MVVESIHEWARPFDAARAPTPARLDSTTVQSRKSLQCPCLACLASTCHVVSRLQCSPSGQTTNRAVAPRFCDVSSSGFCGRAPLGCCKRGEVRCKDGISRLGSSLAIPRETLSWFLPCSQRIDFAQSFPNYGLTCIVRVQYVTILQSL
jgi:hypothetical protein